MCPKCTEKILLFITAYDNELGKSQSNMNISGHDNKDKSSRPGSVLSTSPSSKPAEQKTSLSAIRCLDCTVLYGE